MVLYHIRILRKNGNVWEYPVRHTLKFIERVILQEADNIDTVTLYRIREGDLK